MSNIEGIWAAVVTPVDADFVPDAALALPYYRELLERGCDGINVLGTTGEAMSFSVDQRGALMEAVAASGIAMTRAMVGTGAAALADAVRLTRAAFALGFAAALVMPPFFFRDISDDAILAFFAALFARTVPPRRSILLYNFPRMSGITFHPDLVDRLVTEFPEVIAGMKDSSNDTALQTEIIRRHPNLAVLPGSERDLLSAKARGVAGCISGSVALWPELAQAVFTTGDEAMAARLSARRQELEGGNFIAAVRGAIALARKDPRWTRTVASR